MRCLLATLALCLISAAAKAQVIAVPYADLAQELDGRITFGTLPDRPEPGFNLDAPMRVADAWLGERFAGQAVTGAPHDRLLHPPGQALSIRPGQPGRNLSVAWHRGFASNALFPLGPLGFPALPARGEGAVAVLFDRDQSALGLRLHSSYADPLGTAPQRGKAMLRFYTRSGALVGSLDVPLVTGVTEIGLRRAGDIPDIAGFTLTNTDPGGIAIDDLLYRRRAFLF